jgi:hypothetical protein
MILPGVSRTHRATIFGYPTNNVKKNAIHRPATPMWKLKSPESMTGIVPPNRNLSQRSARTDPPPFRLKQQKPFRRNCFLRLNFHSLSTPIRAQQNAFLP